MIIQNTTYTITLLSNVQYSKQKQKTFALVIADAGSVLITVCSSVGLWNPTNVTHV